MAASDPQPITAESLARRDEWLRAYPDSEIGGGEEADEGRGIGFDGLDPSAMVRAYRRSASPWSEILAWHRGVFIELGWKERSVKDDSWSEWTSADHPGERLWLLDRSRIPEEWPANVHRIYDEIRAKDPRTLFEVNYTARGALSEALRRDA